ncbi:hypothetical protein [Nitrosospira sp. Nsp14]|nr:hypothetical protein [Nitrosospira sp. Nsp14]
MSSAKAEDIIDRRSKAGKFGREQLSPRSALKVGRSPDKLAAQGEAP